MILFHWCRKINIYILKTLSFRVGGGQDKLAWTAYPPGVKIIRVGGKISREILPPGGQAVQGGKINCYTGTFMSKMHIGKISEICDFWLKTRFFTKIFFSLKTLSFKLRVWYRKPI